jgi:PE family
MGMSFVIAAPEIVQAAAENLAGVRATLSDAAAAAAGPTTAVVAAAEDQVSARVAALFGAFGQEYQALSAQTQAFHEQFVNLLNAGAGAYLGAEAANVEQTVASAVDSPVQAMLGHGGAPGGGAIAGGVVGPYQSLIANTAANLQSIVRTWTNVSAPALLHAIGTQTNPQLILTALQSGNPLTVLTRSGQLAQNSANLIQALILPASLSITSLNPPNASLAVGLGLPQLLALDALGAPINAAIAASSSGAAVLNAVRTGDPLAAITAFVDAPANVANAFLNGEATLSVPLPVPGLTADVPFSGVLVPLQPFATTATLPGNPVLQTVTVTGPPIGGLIPALLEYTPQLLASAFGG